MSLQHPDGCWEGEMVWCTMILSQYVIVHHLLGRAWDEASRAAIIRYYQHTRTAEGAWGLHPESGGYVFTTTLAYVALRLLGLGPDHDLVAPARRWLHEQSDGVLANPTWGKFWLALIGLYGYEGVNPVLPELFLLPRWLPFHPARYYCHTRYIYLAMAWLYGRRFAGDLGPITNDLRRELYRVPYETIDFAAHRERVAATDLYALPAWCLRVANRAMSFYDRHHHQGLRRRALDDCLERILYEQRVSNYQALSPVNGLLNCLVLHALDPRHPDLAPSLAGLESWRWDDADGRRYVGVRLQTWDTAFAVQALLAAPHQDFRFQISDFRLATAGVRSVRKSEISNLKSEIPDCLRQAYGFVRDAQLTEELPGHRHQYRDPARGGWCPTEGTHRWPVSDCTAEALSAVLALHAVHGLNLPPEERIPAERLRQAACFILRRQDRDGGFGSYERRRGPGWLEALNPSEMFASCMTEGSYVECTGSALCALAHYQAAYPGTLAGPVTRALSRGIGFLRRSQRPDGSWPGFWGIHFTYGTFHAVRGLHAAGVPAADPALQKAAAWLLGHQRADGGWGEHFRGCLEKRYVEHPQSQVVMTSWALLALLEIMDPCAEPVLRWVNWLRARQREDGSWAQDAVTGVFFGTAMLDYRLYKAYFPAWALGRHAALSGRTG